MWQRLVKPEIFTVWPFVEEVCHSLLQGRQNKRQTITYARREDVFFPVI